MRFRTCWTFVLAIVLSLCLPRTEGFSDLSLTNDNGIEVASAISLDLPVLAIDAANLVLLIEDVAAYRQVDAAKLVLRIENAAASYPADVSFIANEDQEAQVLIASARFVDTYGTQLLTPRPTHSRWVQYHLRT